MSHGKMSYGHVRRKKKRAPDNSVASLPNILEAPTFFDVQERGEKLYVTKDKRRPTSWRRCLSWIVACTVITVVLIVAILAGTGVILSQDQNLVKEASVGRNFAGSNLQPSVTQKSSVSPTDVTHIYVPRSIESELVIDNMDFNPDLENVNSSAYQHLSNLMEDQLKMILFDKETLEFGASDIGVRVVNVSRDPFKVNYRIGWNYKQGVNSPSEPITMEDVKRRVVEALARNQGLIDKFHIDSEAIKVNRVTNICQMDNGGCSHICYYNYITQQFTCTCPTHLVLDKSNKNCVTWTGFPEEDVAPVPNPTGYPGSPNGITANPAQEQEFTRTLEHGLHGDINEPLKDHYEAGAVPVPEPTPELGAKDHEVNYNGQEPASEPTAETEPEPQPNTESSFNNKYGIHAGHDEATAEPSPEPTSDDKNKSFFHNTDYEKSEYPEHGYKNPMHTEFSEPTPEPNGDGKYHESVLEPTAEPEPEPNGDGKYHESLPQPTAEPEPEPSGDGKYLESIPKPTAEPGPEPSGDDKYLESIPEPTAEPDPTVKQSQEKLEHGNHLDNKSDDHEPAPEPTAEPDSDSKQHQPVPEQAPEPSANKDREMFSHPMDTHHSGEGVLETTDHPVRPLEHQHFDFNSSAQDSQEKHFSNSEQGEVTDSATQRTEHPASGVETTTKFESDDGKRAISKSSGHHVPYLEDILIKDSSLHLTDRHHSNENSTSANNPLENVEISSKGEPVIEEIIINSNPSSNQHELTPGQTLNPYGNASDHDSISKPGTAEVSKDQTSPIIQQPEENLPKEPAIVTEHREGNVLTPTIQPSESANPKLAEGVTTNPQIVDFNSGHLSSGVTERGSGTVTGNAKGEHLGNGSNFEANKNIEQEENTKLDSTEDSLEGKDASPVPSAASPTPHPEIQPESFTVPVSLFGGILPQTTVNITEPTQEVNQPIITSSDNSSSGLRPPGDSNKSDATISLNQNEMLLGTKGPQNAGPNDTFPKTAFGNNELHQGKNFETTTEPSIGLTKVPSEFTPKITDKNDKLNVNNVAGVDSQKRPDEPNNVKTNVNGSETGVNDTKSPEELSNNIKDEGVENEEFNTLLDKDYKTKDGHSGDSVINKYPNKALKGDRKKVKDYVKGDKTEVDLLPGEGSARPGATPKDYILQKHGGGNTFHPDSPLLTTTHDGDVLVLAPHEVGVAGGSLRPHEVDGVPGVSLRPHEVDGVPGGTIRPHEVEGVPGGSPRPHEVDGVPEVSFRPHEVDGVPEVSFRPHEVDGVPGGSLRPHEVDGVPGGSLRPHEVDGVSGGSLRPHEVDGVPGVSLRPHGIDNHDISVLQTVAPNFKTDAIFSDDIHELEVKPDSKSKVTDNKDGESKLEKEYPKFDKDYKYDKQKGSKKKDLKKKGSGKDGKNVELEDVRKILTDNNDKDDMEKDLEITTGPAKDIPDSTMNPYNDKITESYVVGTEMTSRSSSEENSGLPQVQPQGTQTKGLHESLATGTQPNEFSVGQTTVTPAAGLQGRDVTEHPGISNSQEGVGRTHHPDLTTLILGGSTIKQETATKDSDDGFKLIPVDQSGHLMVDEPLAKNRTHVTPGTVYDGPLSGVVNSTTDPNIENSHSFFKSTIFGNGEEGAVRNGASETNFKVPETVFDDKHRGTMATSTEGNESTSSPHGGVEQKILLSQETPDSSRRLPSHDGNSSTVSVSGNSTKAHPTIIVNGQSGSIQGGHTVRLSSTTFGGFVNGTTSVPGSVTHADGHPFDFANASTFPNGSTVHPTILIRGQSGALQGGHEIKFGNSTLPSHVIPPGAVDGQTINGDGHRLFLGNSTIYRIENGSLPGTVFDGHFNPTNGHYHMFTNSSGSFVYTNQTTQPTFVIKGESGDFGNSKAYIFGNGTADGLLGNFTGPQRIQTVIFRNATVFAVGNASRSDGSPVEIQEVAIQPHEMTSDESIEFTHQINPTALLSGTAYKVNNYFGYVSKCAAGQFQCVNGTSKRGASCINLSSKCDSINDCSDGSDELGCIENGCPGNFQCSDGTCLKRNLVCNGIVDCSNGDDEKQCESWKCEFDEFQCPSGRCIPIVWQCDGKPDCDNHTDEYHCQTSCGNDEYLCPEGWCIPLTYKCNGIKECSNGEDEQLCDCSLDEFKCQTGGCISKSQVCNGLDDCPDRSDEWDCIQIEPNTSLLKIRTASGSFEPVCADNWSSLRSDELCASLGYYSSIPLENDHSSSVTTEKSFYALKNGTTADFNKKFLLNLERSVGKCSSGKLVAVNCQEFSCGSRSMTDSSSVEARFIGGMSATAGQWPSVALLYNGRNFHSCTANVLTPRWVLASYNCLKSGNKNINEQDWKLFGGSTVFEVERENAETRRIISIVSHPQVKFNQFLFSNDLALVELDQPLHFTSNIGAVCLPEQEIQPRQICVTAGWGMNTPEDKSIKQQLQYLPVPTMNLTECNSTEHYSGFITDDKICAGFNTANKSLCYNEEGAPLMCVNDRGEWELQGVLSYHSNCGRGSHPSIFSSITPVRDWIKKTIGNNFDRKVIAATKR